MIVHCNETTESGKADDEPKELKEGNDDEIRCFEQNLGRVGPPRQI